MISEVHIKVIDNGYIITFYFYESPEVPLRRGGQRYVENQSDLFRTMEFLDQWRSDDGLSLKVAPPPRK